MGFFKGLCEGVVMGKRVGWLWQWQWLRRITFVAIECLGAKGVLEGVDTI